MKRVRRISRTRWLHPEDVGDLGASYGKELGIFTVVDGRDSIENDGVGGNLFWACLDIEARVRRAGAIA